MVMTIVSEEDEEVNRRRRIGNKKEF